jgi:hypothetical protein
MMLGVNEIFGAERKAVAEEHSAIKGTHGNRGEEKKGGL